MKLEDIVAMVPEEKTLENDFAANFLATVGAQNIKKPREVLVKEILTKISEKEECFLLTGTKEGQPFNIDNDITWTGAMESKVDIVFISYMLSAYYKNDRLPQGGPKKYRFNVRKSAENPPKVGSFEFYSLKNTPVNTNAVNITTDQDTIHASILGLNMIVKGMRKLDMAGMHPLRRVAASELNIDVFKDFIDTNPKMARYANLQYDSKITAVKLYNTACTRKAHQFYGQTNYYCPELAAAILITGVMSSKKNSEGLLKIADSSLQKIPRSLGSLDTTLVMDIMEFTVSSGAALDAAAIFRACKDRKALYVNNPLQATASSLIAYAKPEGEESSSSSSPPFLAPEYLK